MIVNMGLVDMGADDKGMISFGKTFGQLAAQAVRFLRCDLTGNEGLAQMIGNHIVLATDTACLLNILLLRKQELGISDLAVALVAGD